MKRSDIWRQADSYAIAPKHRRRLRLQKSDYALTMLRFMSDAAAFAQSLSNNHVNYHDDFMNYLASILNNWFAYEAEFIDPKDTSVIYILLSRGLLNVPHEYAVKVAQSILLEEREKSDGFELE